MTHIARESELLHAAAQDQFLEVIDRDTAMQRFLAPLRMQPLGRESVELASALGRILAEDVRADVDVPAFDRSNVDGFAVRATDTIGSDDETPRRLRLNTEVLSPGIAPQQHVEPETATTIATGGMVPRGSDAVVMVEQSRVESRESRVESRESRVHRQLTTPHSRLTHSPSSHRRSEHHVCRNRHRS